MHLLPIDVSSRQLSKLRKGYPVRIKKGTGFNLVVSPNNYRLATRAFGQNKGLEIKLTPEELQANKGLSPEQHAQLMKETKASSLFNELPFAGRGIFDDIKKNAGPVLKEVWNEVGPELKGIAKDYLKEQIRGSRGSGLIEDLNHQLGTNMGYLNRANVGSYMANLKGSKLDTLGFDGKKHVAPIKTYWDEPLAPPSRGTGIRHHQMSVAPSPYKRSTGMIMGKGNLHASAHLPPALQSQPYGVNFHMQFMLPPQYQKFNRGGNDIGDDINGSGLYA